MSATNHPSSSTPTHTPESEPVLLTAQQLAKALGVSRRTLTTWDQRGIIPSLCVGRVRRYELDRVRAALRQYEQPAPQNPPLPPGLIPSTCAN